jgi:hypothetical protein
VIDEVPEEDVPGAMSQMFSEHMFTFEKFESVSHLHSTLDAIVVVTIQSRSDSPKKMSHVRALRILQGIGNMIPQKR